jgi:4-aminobutyrate aminotransferase
MIADEVQTGMGRTGKWWGMQHHGVEPDIVCSAKGIASGMPLGATIAKSHLMNWPPGAHGTTFGGNPVSCAAALVTIDLIEKGYMQNAAEQGAYILDALEELRPHHPTMQHARIAGKGLMVGLELVLDEARTPAKEIRNSVERHAIHNGLLLLGAGENTLRFIPPLMIERDLVDEGLKRFDKSLTEAEHEAGLV